MALLFAVRRGIEPLSSERQSDIVAFGLTHHYLSQTTLLNLMIQILERCMQSIYVDKKFSEINYKYLIIN